MVGGVGVRLAPWCGVSAAPLFLCIDVDADPRESVVRMASSIERDWLPLTSTTVLAFDEKSERIVAKKNLMYKDLILESNDAHVSRSEEVSRMLAESARTRLERVLPDAESAAGSFLVRLRWLREAMPQLALRGLAGTHASEVDAGPVERDRAGGAGASAGAERQSVAVAIRARSAAGAGGAHSGSFRIARYATCGRRPGARTAASVGAESTAAAGDGRSGELLE
jgi:hypothetical protein